MFDSGLLRGRPARPYGNQRAYPRAYVEPVHFIKRAQALGFSLAEIAELLTLERGAGHACAHALASKRLAEIEAKLADLPAMRDALPTLVRECERAHGKVACPIIESIASAPVPRQPARRRHERT